MKTEFESTLVGLKDKAIVDISGDAAIYSGRILHARMRAVREIRGPLSGHRR